MFDKTIANATDHAITDAEAAVDKAVDHAAEEGTKVINIGFTWLDTHRLKVSGSGSFELHFELVPKDQGPPTPQA